MLTEDLTPGADAETATLAWLVSALEHARSRGQTKLVGYLEEVADDVWCSRWRRLLADLGIYRATTFWKIYIAAVSSLVHTR